MDASDRELLDRHVAAFDEGVRTGDFAAMLARFADDAELHFEGVPVGPFSGRAAIAAAYPDQPPDDEIELLDAGRNEHGEIVAGYAWRAEGGRRSGELRLRRAGDHITRLVVAFVGG